MVKYIKEIDMHTIQLQLSDDLYNSIKDMGIDINEKVQDFLYNLVDDNYPAISFDEAKQRVSDAVDRYHNGIGVYVKLDEKFQKQMDNFIENL